MMTEMKTTSVCVILLIELVMRCLCCSLSSSGPITCEDMKRILKYHNEARARVARGEVVKKNQQEPAEDMLEMRWSAELAYKSSRWAERCAAKHSPQSDRPNTGENLASISRSKDDDVDLVPLTELWYKEVEEFGYDGKYSKNTGHFGQMIWGSSDELGCGFSRYAKGNGYTTLFVCRYRPPGNYPDRKAYTFGQPNCAAHGLHNSIAYKGLCTKLSEDEQKNYDPCADTYSRASITTLSKILFCCSIILFVIQKHIF